MFWQLTAGTAFQADINVLRKRGAAMISIPGNVRARLRAKQAGGVGATDEAAR